MLGWCQGNTKKPLTLMVCRADSRERLSTTTANLITICSKSVNRRNRLTGNSIPSSQTRHATKIKQKFMVFSSRQAPIIDASNQIVITF